MSEIFWSVDIWHLWHLKVVAAEICCRKKWNYSSFSVCISIKTGGDIHPTSYDHRKGSLSTEMTNPKCYDSFLAHFLKSSLETLCKRPCRKALLKGKAQYSWPPCTNLFRSAPFYIKILFPFFTKQATLMRRSIVLSLPPLAQATLTFRWHYS